MQAGAYPSGLALFYLGLDGTNPSGCGFLLPGIGELLLGLVPAPLLLHQGPTVGGTAGFVLPIPPSPGLVGFQFALQAANVGVFEPGLPMELSNALLVTISS